MPFAPSHGRDIYYERHGQGPAVLFCHGAGSNAATWWQQLPTVSREFTCITIDTRCFGRSVAPLEEFDLALFVDDVLAVLDAERIDRVALVGQSLGGMIGLRMALQHPGRVSTFVACDTSLAVDHPALIDAMARRAVAAQALTVEERSLGRWFLQNHPERAALYAQINHFNPSAYAFTSEGWGAAVSGLMAPHNLLPMDRLRDVACPTLLIVGSEDPLVPVDVVHEFARHIAHSEVRVIDQAGHSAYFEKADEFNGYLMDFLRRYAVGARQVLGARGTKGKAPGWRDNGVFH